MFGDTVPGGLWQRVVVGLSRLDGGNRSAGTHSWITARAGLGRSRLRSRLRVHQRPIHTCPVDVIFAASNLDLKSTNCLTASDAPVSPVYLANRSDGAALSTDMSAATSGVAPTPSRASAAVSCHLPSVRVLSGGRTPTARPPGWCSRL